MTRILQADNPHQRMTFMDWEQLTHFKPVGTQDRWGNPNLMDRELLFALEDLRNYTGRAIHIHCGYDKRDTPSWHEHGKAVDLHIEGLSVIDQFIAASRIDSFNGMGLYFWWNNPGLHLDTRPKTGQHMVNALWLSPTRGKYIPLTESNLRAILA
jgi:uncharacterized protein YcbK (DUF882 family)